MSSSFLKIMSQDDYTVISDTIAARVTNNGAVLFTKIATKQEYFFKQGKMKIIDGEPYFYYVQPQLAKSANISVGQLKRTIEKLEKEGLLFVKRSVDDTGYNYYRINTARLIEIFNTQAEDTSEAKANYMKKQLEMNREKEEIERELQQMDEFLRREQEALQEAISGKQNQKVAAKEEKAAAAAAQVERIEDMLPTGMMQAAEPAPFASEPMKIESEPVPPQQERKPAPNKRAAERAAEDRREVMETPGLYEIYTYIQRAYMWNDESIIELCLWLKDSGKHMHISRGDIDKGFIDYANYDKQVSKPARFVGACIEKRLDDRLAKQGINVAELESGLQIYEFIEKYRAINPEHPMVLKYDAEQREKGFALA